MTSNLVVRLRDNPAKTYHSVALRREAADEIERLRAALDKQHEDCFRLGCKVDRLSAALEKRVGPNEFRRLTADETPAVQRYPVDKPIWICSVCAGWNWPVDKHCTHTHELPSKTSEGST